MLIVIGIFAVVQVIDQNVLSPIIFGQRVQMNFLLIIFSTVVGGLLLGIAGAFLAVPAAVVLQVILVQIVAPAIRRANGITPEGAALPVRVPKLGIRRARRKLASGSPASLLADANRHRLFVGAEEAACRGASP